MPSLYISQLPRLSITITGRRKKKKSITFPHLGLHASSIPKFNLPTLPSFSVLETLLADQCILMSSNLRNPQHKRQALVPKENAHFTGLTASHPDAREKTQTRMTYSSDCGRSLADGAMSLFPLGCANCLLVGCRLVGFPTICCRRAHKFQEKQASSARKRCSRRKRRLYKSASSADRSARSLHRSTQ